MTKSSIKQQGKWTTETLQKFFEEQEFNVDLFKQEGMQCAEIEKWTDGGVDMNIALTPFIGEKFIEYVKNFDVDEEIDLHRQDKAYRNAFKISESVKDFNKFHKHLKKIASMLK